MEEENGRKLPIVPSVIDLKDFMLLIKRMVKELLPGKVAIFIMVIM
jgi:hypothetical protein